MDYKNFIPRILVSSIFLSIYILISNYKFDLIYYIIILIYIFILIEVFLYFKKKQLLIILYLFLSFIFFIFIDFNENNYFKINLMFLIIITFDIFSYIFGSIIGRYKILKKISPNKTLEGFIGGFLIALIFGLIFSLINNLELNINVYLFILIIIFSSFIGDIIESIFKRANNIKNSSSIIPGHGGFFDRFDSFLLSIIPFLFLSESF